MIQDKNIEFTLMDIGASGKTHPPFKKILPFSTLIRFDPDLREMQVAKESGKGKNNYKNTIRT
jgi:hypothetical protein